LNDVCGRVFLCTEMLLSRPIIHATVHTQNISFCKFTDYKMNSTSLTDLSWNKYFKTFGFVQPSEPLYHSVTVIRLIILSDTDIVTNYNI